MTQQKIVRFDKMAKRGKDLKPIRSHVNYPLISRKKMAEKDTIKWRSKPSQAPEKPTRQMFNFQFRLSHVMEGEAPGTFCHHLRDSLDSHVVEFDPQTRSIKNPNCKACMDILRADSCAGYLQDNNLAKGGVRLPPLQRQRSQSVVDVAYERKMREKRRSERVGGFLPPILRRSSVQVISGERLM